MSSTSPVDLARRLGSGLLSFPVTHFRPDDGFDRDGYASHIEWLARYPVAGLFAAGGTGEFPSLVTDEVDSVVRTAIDASRGSVPVVAPAGRSVAEAKTLARAAEAAGADGLLLFPPFMVESSQEGLRRYVAEIARATGLGVIVYSRANAVYSPETVARLADDLPNFVGLKDGVGSLELMTRVISKVGDRLLYIGGLPTAEAFALPYLELGVTTYSSAIFNFAPQFAIDFYRAVRERDRGAVFQALENFVFPLTAIRDRTAGYAVSMIKAGMIAIGRGAGPVRPPLCDLTPAEIDEIRALLLVATVQPTRGVGA